MPVGPKQELPHSQKQEVHGVLAALRITDPRMFEDAALISLASQRMQLSPETGSGRKQIVPWRQHRPGDTLILSLITVTNVT